MGGLTVKAGQRFGRWVTVEWMPGSRESPGRWRLRCDCGTEGSAETNTLRSGDTRSCGCLKRERAHLAHHIHGWSHTPEHQTWCNIIARCENPNRPEWMNYGGRGISVCRRWRASFLHFLADMGERPGPGYTLERIKNGRGYSPTNCRWATRAEQAKNTRRNRRVRYRGESLTLAEWGRRTGIDDQTLKGRLDRGRPIAQALGFASR